MHVISGLILVFSFINGTTAKTLSTFFPMPLITDPFYNQNNNFLFSGVIFNINSLRPSWSLRDTLKHLKFPVLDATSIKEKDSMSYIGINFATPIFDTNHIFFSSFITEGEKGSYTSRYLIGHLYNSVNYSSKAILLYGQNNISSGIISLKTKNIFVYGSTSYLNGIKYVRLRLRTRTLATNPGVFVNHTEHATYYGPYIEFHRKGIKFSGTVPINAPSIFTISIYGHTGNFNIFLERELYYDLANDTVSLLKRGSLQFSHKGIEVKTWALKNANTSAELGMIFAIKAPKWLNSGFITRINATESRCFGLLGISKDFYNGELSLKIMALSNGMEQIYYSVEFLLFKNLILRMLRNENGDFIGVFTRLVN